MVTYKEFDDQVWKALSDRRRRKILDVLKAGPKSTGAIVNLFPELGRTGVLKHIKVLEEVNLINIHREGRLRWNYLNPIPIKKSCSRWIDKHIQGLASSMSHLKSLAEQSPKK